MVPPEPAEEPYPVTVRLPEAWLALFQTIPLAAPLVVTLRKVKDPEQLVRETAVPVVVLTLHPSPMVIPFALFPTTPLLAPVERFTASTVTPVASVSVPVRVGLDVAVGSAGPLGAGVKPSVVAFRASPWPMSRWLALSARAPE